MATIILAWELGGGLGHLNPLCALADVLSSRGHRAVMVLREISAAAPRDACAILQAPIAPERPRTPIEPIHTFAQVLHNCGFEHSAPLEARVRSWLAIFDYVRPDVVVLDHSPTALVALRAARIPCALFGIGFSVPIDEYPLRNARRFPPPDPDRLRSDEDMVARRVNDVIRRVGGRPVERLGQLFSDANDCFLTTYEELDHYEDRSESRYFGILSRRMGARPAWPRAAGPRIFGYLKPFPGMPALIGMLKQSGARVNDIEVTQHPL